VAASIERFSTNCYVVARKALDVRTWPEPAREGYMQARQLYPGTSDVDFIGDLKRVVDVNTEVAYCSAMIDGWSRSWQCSPRLRDHPDCGDDSQNR
jgi:hypothetical protein